MSQADLAVKIDRSVQDLRRWESGRDVPDTFSSLALCRTFGIDLNHLFADAANSELPEWLLPWSGVLFELDEEGRDAILAVLRLAAPRTVDYEIPSD
jgi:DNA-binding XRE family transcriptional regulator